MKQLMAMLLLVLMTTACSAPGGAVTAPFPQVRQVAQSAHCGLTGPGVVLVRSDKQRETLLDVYGQNITTDVIRKVDLNKERLVIIALGQQPTAGYRVGLKAATATGQTLRLVVNVDSPGPGKIVAQVVTSPCVVLAVASHGWQRLEVTGLLDNPLVKNIEN